MKKLDPTVARVLMIFSGVAVAIAAKVWLADSGIADDCKLAAGWLIGQAMRGPGYIDIKELESLRPPGDRP